MVKLCSVVVMILVVVLAAGSTAAAQDTDKALYAALLEADAIDRTFDPWMQPALTALLREAEIDEPVVVNAPTQPKTFNVLVVDRKKLAAVRTDHAIVKRLLPNIANNVLAIPPGTIVLDKSVIAALFLNAHNDVLGLVLGVDAATKLGPRASPEAMKVAGEKFGALANYLRYTNIRNDRDEFNPGTSAALGPMMMQAMQELSGDEKGNRKTLPRHTMMLAPIVLHEIGHLRRGTTGAYEQALGGPLGAAVLSVILQEENAADDYAVERMQRVVRKRVAHWRGSVQGLTMELQSAISTIKYMRDQVLEDTFAGFRGLNAEDFLVGIEHWDCNVRKGIETLRFDNGSKVRSAWIERLPLLTQAEFDEARTRIQRRVANGTHSHHFTRGDRFLAVIEREANREPYTTLFQSLTFLDAVIRNDPMRLAPLELSTAGTGLPFDEFTRQLPSAEFLPAANCPGTCAVIRFKDHAGFAEVIGSKNDLRRARVTFPLFGPSSVRPDKESEEYLKYVELSIRVLASVMGDKTLERPRTTAQFLQAPAVQLSIRMRKMSVQCGVGSVGTPVGKRYVSIRTLNEKNWVTIDVEPLPPTAQQAGPKGKRK